MEAQTHMSTNDVYLHGIVKKEMIDNQATMEDCNDFIMPIEDLSNSSLHQDLNEQNVGFAKQIQTELALSNNGPTKTILQRQYKSSEYESVSVMDVFTGHTVVEIKLEQCDDQSMNTESTLVHDIPLLKNCSNQHGKTAEKKEHSSRNYYEKIYSTLERASQPSRAQTEALLDFLEENRSLAKGFPKVPAWRESARKSWEALAIQLNSLEGCVKSWKQWTKYWADKKSAVKKKGSLRAQAMNQPAGDVDALQLTEVEGRILALLVEEAVETADRRSKMNSLDTATLNTTTTGSSQSAQESSPLLSQLLEADLTPPPEDRHVVNATSIPSDVTSTRPIVLPLPVVPPPPHAPVRARAPPAPSGSGAHPYAPLRARLLRQRLLANRTRPSPNIATSSHPRMRRTGIPHLAQRAPQFNRISERFLALEERRINLDRQRIEVDRERIEVDRELIEVNRQEIELARINSQTALQVIGEGLKLLAEALKK